MTIKKRFLSVLLCAAMALGLLPVMETTAKATKDDDTIKDELYAYANVVDGKFWNKYKRGNSKQQLINELNEAKNNPEIYKNCTTETACASHDSWQKCESNLFPSEFYSEDSQCSGFASYIAYMLFGYDTSDVKGKDSGSFYTKSYDFPSEFHPGDIIRYYASGDGGHSAVVVEEINGQLVMLDCNWRGTSNPDFRCKIQLRDSQNDSTATRKYISEHSFQYVISPNSNLRNNTVAVNMPNASVSAGDNAVAVIKSDHSLWIWGNNIYARQNGNDIMLARGPIKVMEDIAAVNVGEGPCFAAIKLDGSLWMWGYNKYGQLGNGTKDNSFEPIPIMNDVVAVSIGNTSTAAIKSDGSLWTWGWNEYGQLGDGTKEDSLTPKQIMENVSVVSVGGSYGAAVKTDGTLWMWGHNNYVQLGIGEGKWKECYPTPVKILSDVTMVSCGNAHTAAIRSDGSLWMWGNNWTGECGIGSSDNTIYVPTKVMDGVASISMGNEFSTIVKVDGSLWTYGSNYGGYRLGNNGGSNATYEKTPIQTVPVKIMEDVSAVGAGLDKSIALKQNGSIWTWGKAYLGDGTDDNSMIPVEITNLDDISNATAETPSSWAIESVNNAISKSIVPQELRCAYTQPITRVEFCKLAASLYEAVYGEVKERQRFSDTNDVNAEKMAALGVVNGVGDGLFMPDSLLTREQAATMLSRLAVAMKKPLSDHNASFIDNKSISSWAIGAVGQVQANGVMGGIGNNTFDPQGNYTREQSIITIYRLSELLKD